MYLEHVYTDYGLIMYKKKNEQTQSLKINIDFASLNYKFDLNEKWQSL